MKKQQLLIVAKVMSLAVILILLSSCEGSEGQPWPQGELGLSGQEVVMEPAARMVPMEPEVTISLPTFKIT